MTNLDSLVYLFIGAMLQQALNGFIFKPNANQMRIQAAIYLIVIVFIRLIFTNF